MRKPLVPFWLLTFALLAMPSSAPVFGQVAPKPIVLRASRLFDGKSGQIVTPGIVVVFDGKIVGVGTAASIPADAQTIDLGDATLLPGFIDAHTHVSAVYSED